MKFLFERDTWQEVYDSVTKNKLRTAITMIGVWWGILLLIALLGAARGMENSFSYLRLHRTYSNAALPHTCSGL